MATVFYRIFARSGLLPRGRRLWSGCNLLVSFAVGLVVAGAVSAQAVPAGGEFEVNSDTIGSQREPEVAIDAEGNFVVVWTGNDSPGTPSIFRIRGQRFDSDGGPLGGEFQVNKYAKYRFSGYAPSVAQHADGSFVVVWASRGSAGFDRREGTSIQARRFDPSGVPLEDDFEVNTYTTNRQSSPAVSLARDGSFVVVWHSFGSSESDQSTLSIQGQRFAASGVPRGAQFQVNTHTPGAQVFPAIAHDADDGFVVAWRSDSSSGTDQSGYSVQARRFDAAGVAQGPDFQVNTTTANFQSGASVAAYPDGGFIVVWSSTFSAGNDRSGSSIQAQRFDALGVPLADEFQVNTYTRGSQSQPRVASSLDGGLTLVWSTFSSSPGSDRSFHSVVGHRIGPDGATIAADFQVNTYGYRSQSLPTVAVDREGDFVVVWESEGSSGVDTSYRSIQGQRYRVTGDVGDRVFLDRNFDGIQSAGETGIGGVPVHLFDSFSTLVASTTTDSAGSYRFEPLPGDYFLRFELPSVYAFTPQDRGGDDSADSDAEVSSGETVSFSVTAGGDHSQWDAGMASGVGDRVWLDTDGDGWQDGGEPGMGGVEVELRTGPGVAGLVASTTTDSGGRYTFAELGSSLYYLEILAPAGFLFTAQDAGVDEERDSDVDPQTGATPIFAFTPGDLDLGWDAGLIPEPAPLSAAVGDRVWLDGDGDGFQDGGEPGRSGVVVDLFTAAGSRLASTVTDASGGFLFDGLAAGDYYLQFTAPSGFLFTAARQGADPARDSDPDPATGATPEFRLEVGAPDLGWDAGLVPEPVPLSATVGDRVWLDGDGDGFQDGGEPGRSGVVVDLYTSAGSHLASTVSDASGGFLFDGLAAGDYYLQFTAPSGFLFTAARQGADPARDSDADPVTGTTPEFRLEVGAPDLGWDAGLIPEPVPPSATVGDRVWLDGDGDGFQDGGELGRSGVVVDLYTAAGSHLASTVSDASGGFLFDGLAAGDYYLQFTAPSGFLFTAARQGADPARDSDADPVTGTTPEFRLEVGAPDLGWDAGLIPEPPVLPATIGDRVWLDTDLNGIQDGGEPGLEGIEVRLFLSPSGLHSITRTDADGHFSFVVAAGSYYIAIPRPPSFFTARDQGGVDTLDSDTNPGTGTTVPFVVSQGDANLEWDTGFVPLLGDRVWNDDNGDGLQQSDEPGMAGVTVRLFDDLGQLVSARTTDTGGRFAFPALATGTYTIEVIPPPGFRPSPAGQGSDEASDSDLDPVSGRATVFYVGGTFDDRLDAGMQSVVFADGFESGDVAAWSAWR